MKIRKFSELSDFTAYMYEEYEKLYKVQDCMSAYSYRRKMRALNKVWNEGYRKLSPNNEYGAEVYEWEPDGGAPDSGAGDGAAPAPPPAENAAAQAQTAAPDTNAPAQAGPPLLFSE
jgi:hypothetical protein